MKLPSVYLVSATIALGLVSAGSDCDSNKTYTKSDILELEQCKKFKSNVDLSIDDKSEIQFNKVEEIKNNSEFSIKGSSLVKISFPNLESTKESKFTIKECPKLKELSVPKLKKVDEFIFKSNDILEKLNFPSLEKIKGKFKVKDNKALAEFEMDIMTQLEGDLEVTNNPKLAKVSLKLIQSADTIEIEANEKLAKIKMSNLKTINKSLKISGNKALQVSDFDMNKLEKVGEEFKYSKNTGIKELKFDSLASVKSLKLESNSDLTTLEINKLAKIDGDLTITDNKELKTINLVALKEVKGTITIKDKSIKGLSFEKGFKLKKGDTIESGVKCKDLHSAYGNDFKCSSANVLIPSAISLIITVIGYQFI